MPVTTQVARVKVRGPLVECADGFEAELQRLSYLPASMVNQFHLLAHFSYWLEAEGLALEDLTVEQVDAFLDERRRTRTALFSHKAIRPLLGWLAATGVIAEAVAMGALPPEDPAVLVRFEQYLLRERRIGASTTMAYVVRIRRFLAAYVPAGGFTTLGGAEVTRALLDEGAGRAPASVKKFGYALRSFLRFCFITGELDRDLTGATLVIRNPLPSLLPVGASAAHIETL